MRIRFRLNISKHVQSGRSTMETAIHQDRPGCGAVSMSTYFKPLRRKVGVVALMLACCFMAGWMRSRIVADVFSNQRTRLISEAGKLVITRRTPVPSHASWSIIWTCRRPNAKRNPLTNRGFRNPLDHWDEFRVDWRHDAMGFHFGSGRHISWSRDRIQLWIIPYWPIAMTLTFVAFWLLIVPIPVKRPPTESQSVSATTDGRAMKIVAGHLTLLVTYVLILFWLGSYFRSSHFAIVHWEVISEEGVFYLQSRKPSPGVAAGMGKPFTYSSIVIPLTLISAWLLPSKTRAANSER